MREEHKKMNLKKGQRVRISNQCEFTNGYNNPTEKDAMEEKLMGTVTKDCNNYYWVNIKWDNGIGNTYRSTDFTVVGRVTDSLLQELIAMTNGLAMEV